MTTSTIPAELFLLLTNDAGRQDSTQFRKQALAAAALVELTLREKVSLAEGRNPRVEVVDTASTDIAELDQALGALTELDGKRIASVIGHRWMDLTEVIGVGWAAAGAIERKDGWFLTSWPTQDASTEEVLRARLVAALGDPARRSLQDAILLEMLRALKIAHRILKNDIPGVSRRELDRSIKDLHVDSPATTAVRQIIDDMAAVMVSTQVAMTSS
ncbi:GOLPH3/VPS74 family protein [Brachybacterium tyrofermentans]|uniref:GOLPH3/VPS74 family protein n=1 Tax=Brachybacterium tyrofermentans TaxID=47848 RepID=UPI003FCF8256